ncbi:MAG TPA: transcriptional regulator [Deinococcales bacterium]|nr:transcriptional regulator [Deinococcales bacterium]
MQTTALKLVTIVAEALLEERLVRELRQHGARGYTITEARGSGSRGVRASEWEGKNVRIETLVSREVAERLLGHLAANYFEHFAVVAYVENVEVVRGDKYV